ncbi:3',5'-cyclic adenosine monophosphate phosphodiesterase CpdA [compost metagenome]
MSQNDEITWLHISDIHFHPKTSWRDNEIRNELLSFLSNQFNEGLPKPDLVFCTGDIAFGETNGAPLKEQYTDATQFFDRLLTCTKLDRERLFMVPGNHDVKRKSISKDQQARLTDMANDPRKNLAGINSRFAERSSDHILAMSRLDDYGQFVHSYRPELHFKDYHLYAHTLNVKGYQVGIAGFNSAWSCAGDEDDRHLWLAGEWQFNHMAAKLENADFTIGLIHHPFDWLNEAEHHDAIIRSSRKLNFLLHGHTHTAWVHTSENCVHLAAGAVGADSPEQFGINLVRLNPKTGSCRAHLFRYDNGWMKQIVPTHAPDGEWPFNSTVKIELSSSVEPKEPDRSADSPEQQIYNQAHHSSMKLFGREKLLQNLTKGLAKSPALALYGMRGNGKSEVIRTLKQTEPFASHEVVHIFAVDNISPSELFRQLLNVLNDHAEVPKPPSGNLQSQVKELQERYSSPRPAFVWIDRAHLLINNNQWRSPELFIILQALRIAFPQWRWIFELREKVQPGTFGRDCIIEEVPGLDRAGLAEFLRGNQPTGQDWSYSGSELRSLYQWLGGGHGQQAHPLAIRLLVEVARGVHETPWMVYQNLREHLIERVEQGLLGELFDRVLSSGEQLLLRALALYRKAIPHDHADWLEEALMIEGAWLQLEKRCLLPSDANGQHFFLHGFISNWICHKLGTTSSEEGELETLPEAGSDLANLHYEIGQCWQRQLGRTRRISSVNIERANEACHHLLCAGASLEIGEWLELLLKGQGSWSQERLWRFDKNLHTTGGQIESEINVLQLITRLYPDDSKAWRFLGECLQKARGEDCIEALAAFEQALSLLPTYPQYLANLGQALLARGKSGAEDFLRRLETHKANHPEAVNNYVLSIQNRCIELVSDAAEASSQRRSAIQDGSQNQAFYNDEALYQLNERKDPDEALRLLDLARERNAFSEHGDAIRAKVLEAKGQGREASKLRLAKIYSEAKHPAFYADEALYQVEQKNNARAALDILDLAIEHGCDNHITQHIRKTILQRNKPPTRRL